MASVCCVERGVRQHVSCGPSHRHLVVRTVITQLVVHKDIPPSIRVIGFCTMGRFRERGAKGSDVWVGLTLQNIFITHAGSCCGIATQTMPTTQTTQTTQMSWSQRLNLSYCCCSASRLSLPRAYCETWSALATRWIQAGWQLGWWTQRAELVFGL